MKEITNFLNNIPHKYHSLINLLKNIPGVYDDFILGIYVYVKKNDNRLNKVLSYLENNENYTSSDVIDFISSEPDFFEDNIAPLKIENNRRII